VIPGHDSDHYVRQQPAKPMKPSERCQRCKHLIYGLALGELCAHCKALPSRIEETSNG
jgi:hypothetical protein